MSQIRADIKLFNDGLAKSREKARSLIMAGAVYCNGRRIDKAGELVSADAVLKIKQDPVPYVSRGGLKLKKALDCLPVSVENKVCADIGASSGGFTDCMLQHNAKKVYAIDVGYGQLDWKLRNDHRVVVMERTNARYMEEAWFSESIEFASIDVSFISIKLILKPLYNIIKEGGEVVALIKPQFEAGREKVGKNGVVREAATHIEVLSEAICFAQQLGFEIIGIDYSPITGPKGNIEFLLALRKANEQTATEYSSEINNIVEKAHMSLD